MRKILIPLALLVIIFITPSLFKVSALTQTVENQDVTIDINKDSTFEVTETANYIFNGEFHGLRRDITLTDSSSLQQCQQNSNLTCGGFDRVEVLSVQRSDGVAIPNNQLNFYNVDENGSTYFRIEWEIYSDGKNVSNYNIGWIIKYKVYGGIQEVAGHPYFYWDLLPEDRGSVTNSSEIRINFPDNLEVEQSKVEIFTSLNYKDTYPTNNSIKLTLSKLPYYGAITLAYPFEKGEITLPGSISYEILFPPLGGDVYLDNTLLTQNSVSDKITGITAGDHTLKVTRFGYQDIIKNLTISESENQKYTFSLQQTTLLSFANLINTIATIGGILLLPLTIIGVYLIYTKKGRDINFPKTIIPEFNPPENMRPYLLGSLKDESVDKEDIAGTIIDLAYRGFIKIKELKKNEYELISTGKDDKELDSIEKDILDAIFNGKEKTTTKDMAKTFPYKYLSITKSIYAKMVDEKFFNESPQLTIGKYAGLGVLLAILGGFSIFFLSSLLTELFGYFSAFTLGLDILIAGIGLAIIAKFMPAKTETGSKVYAHILGFKMYLHTAERYRLQKLGPDEFERFLSYAIVFKIEEEWAKKFEGLYSRSPDWYEGSDVNAIYNAYFISTFARSFTASTVSAFNLPSQSASGSGWSGGGGSFGGFSGGGGGGGSSGGW